MVLYVELTWMYSTKRTREPTKPLCPSLCSETRPFWRSRALHLHRTFVPRKNCSRIRVLKGGMIRSTMLPALPRHSARQRAKEFSLFKVKEFVRIFIGIRVWSERAEGTSRPAISLPLHFSLFIVWRRPEGRNNRLYPSFSLPLRLHRSMMVHPDRLLLYITTICLSLSFLSRSAQISLRESIVFRFDLSKEFPRNRIKWGKERN